MKEKQCGCLIAALEGQNARTGQHERTNSMYGRYSKGRLMIVSTLLMLCYIEVPTLFGEIRAGLAEAGSHTYKCKREWSRVELTSDKRRREDGRWLLLSKVHD